MPLFVRSKRGSKPTPAGSRLLQHARRIVALNEAAFDEVRGQAIKGELRVAITDYYGPTKSRACSRGCGSATRN